MAVLTNLSTEAAHWPGFSGKNVQAAGSWVQSNLDRAVAHDVSVTHFVLASSKRELGDRQNKEDNNKQKKGRIYGRQTSFHYTDYCQCPQCICRPILSKNAKEPLHFEKKKKKTYCFNDSMGTDHQIFMVTFPKIKVCSLRLQRICFVEFQGKPFLIIFVFIFGCFSISLVYIFFSKHCYLAWRTHSQGYYENPGILGGMKWT